MNHGLLLIDKHAGCTSHDVVQQGRRLLRQRKVGHCGTLDPAATGLLVLTAGNATRLTRFLIRAPKVYSGTIRFGIETDTYDGAGQVVAEQPVEGLTEERIEAAMAGFVGEIDQFAPSYSAKKVKGQKLYELARRGEEVPRESKLVTIYELLTTGPLAGDEIPFRLGCSSGTYARTLAHDLGQTLGCGGHLASLRRLKVGSFAIEQATTIAELEARAQQEEFLDAEDTTAFLGDSWIPFDQIPLPFGEVITDTQQQQRIQQGQTILARDLEGEEGDWVKVVGRRGRFIAVGSIIERIGGRNVGVIQPKVVFK